ncbi:hypothetical protein [Methylobacterium soli]|uniref:Uncharacterized protein n=1 Tax=Methylobacterium soli TaxID=553447 RepID=A0A6L3STN1_9HYPH|nr:hypothetical protein [Methylobacterium soli]KAB1076529.1 hypothetical protein F6X53_22765 [Methylobacterium soli]GJE44832.1 hypothetical protein AEGHOMDF_4023 [Methylobacterium soli]
MPAIEMMSNEDLASSAYDVSRAHLTMSADGKPKPDQPSSQADESDIAAPRLTPQGRTDPDEAGEDSTDPDGGAKTGQPDKAEG